MVDPAAGQGDESIEIDSASVLDLAGGFSLDSQQFGEDVGSLQTGLTEGRDSIVAWHSASLVAGGDFLSKHGTAKQSAATLLGTVTADIEGMGYDAQAINDGLRGEDGHGAEDIDNQTPGG